jgi:hypothetical protein
MRRWWASRDRVMTLLFVVWVIVSLLRLLSDATGAVPEPLPTVLGVLAWSVPVLIVVWGVRRHRAAG